MQEAQAHYCASCGRSDKAGPDGVETVSYLGIKWCALCAAVGRTSEGGTYVSQPSPGRMVETPLTDPLVAWEDCYSMTPKRRILVVRAKAEVQHAWALWDGDKGSPASMLLFYGWLRRFRPYFLTFRGKGDPWQTVHSWLLQHERTQR
jgi:hypothetical protein